MSVNEVTGRSVKAAPWVALKVVAPGFIVVTLALPVALADAEHLPFPDAYFDRVTVAFGLRNMTHKDRALVELNIAVLHSFARQGVTIVDHHTASRQLLRHEERECQAGRLTPADWGWIVPPLSGSTTPVFHRHYENTILTPNYFYQPAPWYQY